MKKEEGLWSVSPELCRSLGAVFQKRSKYMKFPTWHYTMSLPDVKEDPSLHCLCEDPEDPETCPLKGTFDLFSCMGAPIIASMPHFYNADQGLIDAVDGLSPDQSKHEIFVDFELVSFQTQTHKSYKIFFCKIDIRNPSEGCKTPPIQCRHGTHRIS